MIDPHEHREPSEKALALVEDFEHAAGSYSREMLQEKRSALLAYIASLENRLHRTDRQESP